MGKKGKGRQMGRFASKSARRAHDEEWRELVAEVRSNRPSKSPATRLSEEPSERPRFTRVAPLKGLLQERDAHEVYQFHEQRRQNGFLPQSSEFCHDNSSNAYAMDGRHSCNPPGWLLNYGQTPPEAEPTSSSNNNLDTEQIPTSPSISSLHDLCVQTMGKHLYDYLEAWGVDQLHSTLALLPGPTLTELSILVSKNVGMTNEIAIALATHSHADRMCIHASQRGSIYCDVAGIDYDDDDVRDGVFDDRGLRKLIPHNPTDTTPSHVRDNWEELLDEDDDTAIDALLLTFNGCSSRMERLELVNCAFVSADCVIELLSQLVRLTHLSLAGSLSMEEGPKVFLQLPKLLPKLEILDVSGCDWVTDALFDRFHALCDRRPIACPVPFLICRGHTFERSKNSADTIWSIQDEW